ncbi:MAG: hypothetical protein AAGJ50_01905 [Pseudomonadota bacterium]
MSNQKPLIELQANFRNGSTTAMPIAGLIAWTALGLAALWLDDVMIAQSALYIMAAILPMAYLIDKSRGRNLFAGGTENPLTGLFLWSIGTIAVIVPLVILGANQGNPLILVLGMAILAGVIWIPYGWAADDPVGGRHAIGRAVGCYVAYYVVPAPYQATSICAVVALSYIYSLTFLRR